MTRRAGREYKRSRIKFSTSTMIEQAFEDESEINAKDDVIPIYDCSNTEKFYYEFKCYNEADVDDSDDTDEIDWLIDPPSPLIEDSWKPGDSYNYADRGIGYLRHAMESVKPSEVHTKDLRWVASKYTILSAMITGSLLSLQFFESENKLIFGRYCVELEKMLRKFGIEFKLLGGLTEQGWQTFRNLHGENCAA